jgi:phosphate transport system substrate-binding protein
MLLVGAFSATACADNADGGDAATDGGEISGAINVEGSDTMVNLAQAWAAGFMDENPGVTVSVKGGGSGGGAAALINGTIDFANMSREIKDEEKAEAEAKGVETVEHQVAIDGIAVIVNPDNGVAGLTIDQLGRIYRGEITNWKDLGGADKEIVLLSRDSSSGTYEYFKEAVVAVDDEEAEYATEARNLASSQAIVDEVAANDAAIGYVGLGYLTDTIKVLEIEGTAATIEAAKDGSYVLSRGLYMYSNGGPTDVQAAYLEWILSEAGQKVVEEQGFVPLQ